METRSGKILRIKNSKLSKPRTSTLKKTASDIVGCKKELRHDVLPSNKDVMRYYLWLERNIVWSVVHKLPSYDCTKPIFERSTSHFRLDDNFL